MKNINITYQKCFQLKYFRLILSLLSLILFSASKVSAQTFEDYLQIAAENNPGLQAQHKEFEAALQKAAQASSLPDPTLSVGYFISPVETRVGPQRAKLSLTQMFPWFGTLKAQGDAASLLAEAKYQNYLDAQNRLYFQLSQVYYPLVEIDELKKIEKENIDILQSYKSITTINFENSRGSMVDVLRVDLQLKEAETNLEILNKKEYSLKVWFNSLLNRDKDEAILLPDTLTIDDKLPENYRLDSLLADNPRLKEIDLRSQAFKSRELAANKQFYPNFGLGLDYVIIGESPNSSMEDNGKDAIMPMLSMSIPLFRKKYKSAQKEAQLMQESLELQKEDLTNKLNSNYYRQDFQLRQQLYLMELYNEQIKELEQILRLLYSSYSNSGKEFEEVLRVQQQLLKYERLKVSAKAQYLISLSEMDYLTAKKH